MSKTSNRRVSTLLVADDDSVVGKLISYQFEQAGLYCDLFESGEDLLKVVSEDTQACLLDLQMPGKNGIECMKLIKNEFPHVEVVILTNVNEAAEALEAVRSGAFDYLTKPFDPDELIRTVRKAMRLSRNQRENRELRNSLSEPSMQVDLLGESDVMKELKKVVSRIAQSENTVLLTGESGTGKTLLAHAIHVGSARATGPFVTVSCPSLPGDLLESEMFGHEKGAFSGANQRRLGRAELAKGGTLFLDEIGDMSPSLQAKLLTFLQDKSFYRVGGEKPISSDVRIIAATNQDLEARIQTGQFREDLFFRLNVLPLEMPPLRNRLSDIPALVEHFLNRLSASEKASPPFVDPDVSDYLKAYQWPGNIRELENVIIRAYTFREKESELSRGDITLGAEAGRSLSNEPSPSSDIRSLDQMAGMTLAEMEKIAIENTLKHFDNNKSLAAKTLGIAEKSIYNKMKKHGLGLKPSEEEQ